MPAGKSGRWLVLLAAGRGVRSGQAVNKAFVPIAGACPLIRCLAVFRDIVDGAVVVLGADDQQLWSGIESVANAIMPIVTTTGGATRQQSGERGLNALPPDARLVAVHDAARPFAPPCMIERCFAKAAQSGAAMPAIPVSDSIVRLSDDSHECVPRESLRAVQTPQVFQVDLLRQAYRNASESGAEATDDAQLVRLLGHPVELTEGDPRNIKLTTPWDFELARNVLAQPAQSVRVGFGMDAHRLAEGRDLILCGVKIPYSLGLLGHSDADAATHALIDALLGAASLGDIGVWFPATDPAYKGISSLVLLERTIQAIRACGLSLAHADIMVNAQEPKLAPYILQMRSALAGAMNVSIHHISVKATTTEGLGYTGRLEGIAAYASVVMK